MNFQTYVKQAHLNFEVLDVFNIFLINIFQVFPLEGIIPFFSRIRVRFCHYVLYLSIRTEITIITIKFYLFYFTY